MKELKLFVYHLVRNCSLRLRELDKTFSGIKKVVSKKDSWKEVAQGVTVLWSWIILTVVAFENPAYAAPVAVALVALLTYYVRH